MKWPTWAPRWSLITAAAILVASVMATAMLAVRNASDEPAVAAPTSSTAVVRVDGTTPTAPAPAAGARSPISTDELRLNIAAISAELAATPVVLRTEDGETMVTVADLGVRLEVDATYDAVHDLRASSNADAATDQGWTALTDDPQFSERRYSVDRTVARAFLADASELGVTATPPTVVVVNGTLAVDLGTPGRAVDADAVVDEVLVGISRSLGRIEIVASLVRTAPLAFSDEMQQAVNEAHNRYGHNLTLSFGTQIRELTLETIAQWLALDAYSSPPIITFDDDGVGPYLEQLFAAESAPLSSAAMAVVNGVPTVIASDGGQACCAPEAVTVVTEGLLQRLAEPVALPARPAVSREEQEHLESLGIVELVGTFTTRHTCCQSRVENIQRFADIVRGVIVEPGGSLSLNGHVGRRTEEKGFVEGGFIHKGVLVDDIGGGVSQFATTIFNSLIRAGMDIDEYQTHSLYLSRYPFGLDPTISYPKPDLRFTNPTSYGVLVWPKYTGTSITVELYSTRNVEVRIGEPVETMQDFCRRVRTDLTRVFENGIKVTDTFIARYRPEQGRNCDGSRSVPRQCIDPSLAGETTSETSEDSDGDEPEFVEDGSERDDGSVVECPPPVCSEKPGERESELPRYDDDPCIGVDLTTLVDEADTDAETPDDTDAKTPDDTDAKTPDDTDAKTPDDTDAETPDDTEDPGDELIDETIEPKAS